MASIWVRGRVMEARLSSLHVFCGRRKGFDRVAQGILCWGCLFRIRSQTRAVNILETKLSWFQAPGVGWTPPGLPFVPDPVCGVHGRESQGAVTRRRASGLGSSGSDLLFLQMTRKKQVQIINGWMDSWMDLLVS